MPKIKDKVPELKMSHQKQAETRQLSWCWTWRCDTGVRVMPKTVGGNTCHPWGGTDSSGSSGALVSLATRLKVFLQWHRGTGKSFSKGWILVYLLLPGAFWGGMANTTSPLLKIHLPFFLTDPVLISFRVATCQEKKKHKQLRFPFLTAWVTPLWQRRYEYKSAGTFWESFAFLE